MALRHRHRSAATGRFVSAAYARRWPHKTIREVVMSPQLLKFVRGLTLALVAALAGCKTVPQVEVVEVPGPTRYVAVPAELTAECPVELPASQAPLEAVRVAHARRESLEECNRRLAAIRRLQGTAP
jgi:hypothetical protein